MSKTTFGFCLVRYDGVKLQIEKISSIPLLVTRLTELHGGALPHAATGVFVDWAKKATAGESIFIDEYLVFRYASREK